MLNLVPFGGSRRIMSHCNSQLFLIGKFLQLFLPKPVSGPIGTTSIWSNQQLLLVGIEPLANLLPPAPDTLDGKLCRFMINAHIDKTSLVHQIVNPVGHGFPISERDKVIDIHTGILSFCLPFPPIIFEVAKQFFLFTIHRDLRVPLLFELLDLLVDMLKLGIAVGVLLTFDRLLVGPKRKMTLLE